MALRSTRETWGSLTRALHWLSALLITLGLAHGYWMANMLPRPERLLHYKWHSIVFLYFALLLALRIVWRLGEPTPAMPVGSTRMETAAAHAGHMLLYLLTIALLVTGYMNWSAFPARFDAQRAPLVELWLFGLKVPAVHHVRDMTIFRFWEHAHMYLSWAMAGLVVVHVLAALRHHLVKGNHVMRRMWSGSAG